MDEIEEIKVDKDILNFLKAIYFGDCTNSLEAASSRAYRDMNRTIRFNGISDKSRLELREKVNKLFEKEMVKLTYGQTQKWINMTIKYLYILGANSFGEIFEYLHIPLDNYVFDIARDSLGIERPKLAWSKWDAYDEQYLKYQKMLRKKINEGTPLRWEFRYWLKAARNIKE